MTPSEPLPSLRTRRFQAGLLPTRPVFLGVTLCACLIGIAVPHGSGLPVDAGGNVVGAFAGALAVASAGHLYQYLSKRRAGLVQIPGLITLVPGSMGFRGVHALIEQDSAAGISLLTDMVMTGAVLAVGLLLADNILPLLFERRGGEKA